MYRYRIVSREKTKYRIDIVLNEKKTYRSGVFVSGPMLKERSRLKIRSRGQTLPKFMLSMLRGNHKHLFFLLDFHRQVVTQTWG